MMEDASDLEKTLEWRPASIRPVALDAGRARRAIPSGAIAGLIVATFAFAGAIVARVSAAPQPVVVTGARAATAATAATSASASSSASSSAHSPVPVVSVDSLPRAKDGTVIGAPEHRLWIDGHLAGSWSVRVKCGPHTVQVGSAGAVRTVDVPCGDAIHVSP